MWVMGVNMSHDRAVALMHDEELVVAVEEERIDRFKHSEGWIVNGYFERLSKVSPLKAMTYCLDAAGIGIDDVDLIVGNRPLNDGSARRMLRDVPIRDKSKIMDMPAPAHHLAHAYAGYAPSPFEEAAVLVVDGVGARVPGTGRIEKHTIYRAQGCHVVPVESATYAPDYSDFGLGLMYEFVTGKLGFVTRWGSPSWGSFGCGGYPEAGKTMGLAPYGNPRPDWGDLIDIEGGDVGVKLAHMERKYAEWFDAEGEDFDERDPERWKTQFARDIARKAQDEVERAVVHLARRARELTGSRNLCLTGGVALNSVANQQISAEGLFDEIFILPPAGDAGVCLGAAAYGYHEVLGGRARQPLRSVSLGRAYTDDEIEEALRAAGDAVVFERCDVVREVPRLLEKHLVVGWFQGGSEMGPRALGARSILADARHPYMRDFLNNVVKHREPFRPYAPSVLAERADEWFELHHPSPYMLLVPQVRADKADLVPAITHVDGTARVQGINAADLPRYHSMVAEFEHRTGVPLVLNTSFNDAGEPIVESPADAVRTFLSINLDHLAIGDYLVTKPAHDRHPDHPAFHPLGRP